MDGEAGGVELAVLGVDVAVDVHLHQAGGGDLLEQVAVIVDQEALGLARDAHRHVGVDRVGPAEEIGDAVEGGEVAARLPLGLGHVEAVLLHDAIHG